MLKIAARISKTATRVRIAFAAAAIEADADPTFAESGLTLRRSWARGWHSLAELPGEIPPLRPAYRPSRPGAAAPLDGHFHSLGAPIDTAGPSCMLVRQTMGAFAHSERALIVDRTNSGLAAARVQERVG